MKQKILLTFIAIIVLIVAIYSYSQETEPMVPLIPMEIEVPEVKETSPTPTIIENTELVEKTVYVENEMDGHWEKYCLYPENEQGYRTKGALIRVSSGDCKDNWRVISLWEK